MLSLFFNQRQQQQIWNWTPEYPLAGKNLGGFTPGS